MRAQLAANRERLAYYPPNFTAWYADEVRDLNCYRYISCESCSQFDSLPLP